MTQETKHTPGPWEAVKMTISGHEFWKAICSEGRFPEKGPQAEANARLIAAAPDLLEALTDAVAIIEKYVPQDALGVNSEGEDGPAGQSWPILDEYVSHFKSAIEKATKP